MHAARSPAGVHQHPHAWASPGPSLSLQRSKVARTWNTSTSLWQAPGQLWPSSRSSACWCSSACGCFWPERNRALHRGSPVAANPDGQDAVPRKQELNVLQAFLACIGGMLRLCLCRLCTAAADKQQEAGQQQQQKQYARQRVDSPLSGQQSASTPSVADDAAQQQSLLPGAVSATQQQQQPGAAVKFWQQRFEDKDAVPAEVQSAILEEQWKKAITELPDKYRELRATVIANACIFLIYLSVFAVALKVLGVGQVGLIFGMSELKRQRSPALVLVLYVLYGLWSTFKEMWTSSLQLEA